MRFRWRVRLKERALAGRGKRREFDPGSQEETRSRLWCKLSNRNGDSEFERVQRVSGASSGNQFGSTGSFRLASLASSGGTDRGSGSSSVPKCPLNTSTIPSRSDVAFAGTSNS